MEFCYCIYCDKKMMTEEVFSSCNKGHVCSLYCKQMSTEEQSSVIWEDK